MGIGNNQSLPTLVGLGNLTSIEGHNLSLWKNTSLMSLEGLNNISPASIRDLRIESNTLLNKCEVESICDYLVSPNGDVVISDNATGCSSQEEIEEACIMVQSCLPDGIVFTMQSQIDSFQINYPTCSEIEGDVSISGNDITNLVGLSVLTAIGGDLNINGNIALVNLSGLDNITYIAKDLSINNNSSLTNITALTNLYFVGNDLSIVENTSLINLTGLDNLTTVGFNLVISNNASLSNLSGLENITSVGGYAHISGNSLLQNMTGLDNLKTIGQYLDVNDNNGLQSLTGLNNLTSIGGSLSIFNNQTLVSLSGIENINSNSINELQIIHNPLLSTCDVISVCDYLASSAGQIEIEDNAAGCNSQSEVEAECTDWIPDIIHDSEFTIFPNPTKKEINISSKSGFVVKAVSIYNQFGQKVLHENQITSSVDISVLRQGLYIIELNSNELRVRMKLIIN